MSQRVDKVCDFDSSMLGLAWWQKMIYSQGRGKPNSECKLQTPPQKLFGLSCVV